jgi:acyl carrier protein
MTQKLAAIREVVLEGLHQIAPEADLESLSDQVEFRRELEIDSFDFLRLLIIVHERLGIDVPEADYGGLSTISRLLDYLHTKQNLAEKISNPNN